MRAQRVRHGRFDRVGVGEADDDAAVVRRTQFLERADDPGLHLREALPVREPEGRRAALYGLPLGIALSVFIYYQFGGVRTFAFSLPWGAILACIVGVLAIVFATMIISGAMIRNDNIVDTIKEENL